MANRYNSGESCNEEIQNKDGNGTFRGVLLRPGVREKGNVIDQQ